MTISEFFTKYAVVVDDRIQRKFEWRSSLVESFIKTVVDSSISYEKDYSKYDCKRDFGTLITFEADESDKRNNKFTVYLDDGHQRIITCALMAKALLDTIRMQGDNDGSLSKESVMLESLVDDIKNNLFYNDVKLKGVTDRQENTFSYIMNLPVDEINDTKYDSSNMKKAYRTCLDYFSSIFSDGYEYTSAISPDIEQLDAFSAIRSITKYICRIISFDVKEYRNTSIEIRREKYNEINNHSKPQEEYHRGLSTIYEYAEKHGYTNLKEIYDNCYQYAIDKKIISPMKTMTNYLVSSAINKAGFNGISPNLKFALFMEKRLSQKDDNNGGLAIAQHIFDDFNLYVNLRKRSVSFDIPNTKTGNMIKYYTASLCDLFWNGTSPRLTTCAYYLKIMRQFLIIENDSVFKGIKDDVNFNDVKDLLKYLDIYKFLINTSTVNTVAADERKLFYGFLQKGGNLSAEDIANHTAILKSECEDSIRGDKYNYSLIESLTYGRKGTRFALALLKGWEHKSLIEEARFGYTSQLALNKDLDIDHVLDNKHMGNKYDDSFTNLRLYNSLNNRGAKSRRGKSYQYATLHENGVFGRDVDFEDTSFPVEMRGGIFTEDKKPIRKEWMVKSLKEAIAYLYNY